EQDAGFRAAEGAGRRGGRAGLRRGEAEVVGQAEAKEAEGAGLEQVPPRQAVAEAFRRTQDAQHRFLTLAGPFVVARRRPPPTAVIVSREGGRGQGESGEACNAPA